MSNTNEERLAKLHASGMYLDIDESTIVDSNKWSRGNKQSIDARPTISRSEREYAEVSISDITLRNRSRSLQRVFWDEFQTPITHQGNRDTCSGFAMTAAIEARYRRDYDYGRDFKLSEQFFWHSYKSTSLTYPLRYRYENQSSIWGGGNSHGIRKSVNFAICEKDDLKYLSELEMNELRDSIHGTGKLEYAQDPTENKVLQKEVDAFEYSTKYIPQKARDNCRFGVRGYVLLGVGESRDADLVASIIGSGHEVLIDMILDWVEVPANEIDPSLSEINSHVMKYDPNKTDSGAHCFLLVGFDSRHRVFMVKNSWGGDKYTLIDYELLINRASGGSYITEVDNPNSPDVKGRFLGHWHMNHDGWQGELIIRRYTDEKNSITRLGHYYRLKDGKLSAVNGCFSSDGRTIKFTIENDSNVSPTQQNGQRFELHMWSNHARIAAGTTSYKGTRYGTRIERQRTNARVTNDFSPGQWVGTWKMNHDGWGGILSIDGVDANMKLNVTYVDSTGVRKSAVGSLNQEHPHIAKVLIQFGQGSPQAFLLYMHVHQHGLFSGVTTYKRRPFGVVGHRE